MHDFTSFVPIKGSLVQFGPTLLRMVRPMQLEQRHRLGTSQRSLQRFLRCPPCQRRTQATWDFGTAKVCLKTFATQGIFENLFRTGILGEQKRFCHISYAGVISALTNRLKTFDVATGALALFEPIGSQQLTACNC